MGAENEPNLIKLGAENEPNLIKLGAENEPNLTKLGAEAAPRSRGMLRGVPRLLTKTGVAEWLRLFCAQSGQPTKDTFSEQYYCSAKSVVLLSKIGSTAFQNR